MKALLVAALGLTLLVGSAACHSSEPVIPFPDSGDPCSGGAHKIDCAQYAETTCVVGGTTCPRETYGCADAAYFTSQDYSECPPEAGADAPLLGDVSLFGSDVNLDSPTDAASDAPAD